MIVVVDYGRGNLFSLGQALCYLDATFEITGDPAKLAAAERIILPGVGAFGDAMARIRDFGLVESLKAAEAAGKPLLGICVGCQLLLSKGEEFGEHEGFGFVPGRVARLPDPDRTRPPADRTRIPNIGWRRLRHKPDDPYVSDLDDDTMVYFVHSYAPFVENPADTAATISVNGAAVPAIIRHGSIVGYQFHPEKSGPAGLDLLARFLSLPASLKSVH